MSGSKGRILIADDEESVRSLLDKVLTKLGYRVFLAGNGEEALAKVRDEAQLDLLIMDIRMPKLDGMEAFKVLRREHPELPIIMITAYGSVETTLEVMRLGAFDYLTKPFDIGEIKVLVDKAVSSRKESTVHLAHEDKPWVNAFIGTSSAMQDVFKTIGRVSAADSSVLIQGESGTGKELIARTIHQYSKRSSNPFVSINCGAVPEGVLESEFFGHEKGAFTGAYARKIGKFEFAEGGTIFLDEIGEMSLQLQVKLLRVLQERQFERVGGNDTVSVDVRVIAASNKNLRQSIQEKTFRSDLFYRLNVVSIAVPPLRERKEDIALLAAYFRDKYCVKLSRELKRISPEAMQALENYSWPGNVRELENAIERAVVMGGGNVIVPEDLPEEITVNQGAQDLGAPRLETLKERVKALEKEAIAEALLKTGGNKLQAARLLDLSRKALQYKIEEYGLTVQENEP